MQDATTVRHSRKQLQTAAPHSGESKKTDITRRGLVKGVAAAGTLMASGGCAPLAPAANESALRAASLTAAELRSLTLFCDVIIPATDTGGALAAGTVEFVRKLIDEADDAQRSGFKQGLASLEAEVSREPVDDLTRKLTTILRNADGSSPQQTVQFLRDLRRTVITGYYTSEIGGSQELVYAPVPGEYIPLVEVTAETRAFSNDIGAQL